MKFKRILFNIFLGMMMTAFLTSCVQNKTKNRPVETTLKQETVVDNQTNEETAKKEQASSRKILSEIVKGRESHTVDPSYFNELLALKKLPDNIVTIYVAAETNNQTISATREVQGNSLFQVNGCAKTSPMFVQFPGKMIILFAEKKRHAREFFFSLQEDCRVYNSDLFYLYNDINCSSGKCSAVPD